MSNLSKSRIQSGRQCHKRLWLDIHDSFAAAWRPAAQARLDEGTQFGELARQLLGRGVLIDAGHREVRKALQQTAFWLARPRAEAPMLFEAALLHEGVRVRVDALRREASSDTLIEVKSTSQVKPEYLWDCAIQTWVARGAGRKLARVMLGLVDSDFVYTTPGDYEGLLKLIGITAEVEALLPQIPALVASMQALADGPKPMISTGAHCFQPYACPYIDHCCAAQQPVPEAPPLLPNSGARLLAIAQTAGTGDAREIHNLRDQHIHEASRTGPTFMAPESAGRLEDIPHPRFHLAFETISPVVPRWPGTRPFQQIPFRFSCHIESGDGSLRHQAFVDVSGELPLAGFVEQLLDVLGNEGAVLVCSKRYSSTLMRELATMLPQHALALMAVAERMVDMPSSYCEHRLHPNMGLYTTQAVWPANSLEPDRTDVSVAGYPSAQEAFRRALAPDIASSERGEIARQLLAFGKRDSLAMSMLTRLPTQAEAADTAHADDMDQPATSLPGTAQP